MPPFLPLAGVLLLAAAAAAVDSATPTVRTTSGTLSGAVETAGKIHVETFKGIPYAAPPVGKLRWRSPQPAASWTGTKAATKFGAACPQEKNSFTEIYPVAIAEDCLFLNVYRPINTTSADRLPVMIFFHGGSYVLGAASFLAYEAAERVAQSNNVIIVTVNYRLQALGYLGGSLLRDPVDNSTGNWGLKDQRFAMEWVQANAANFGGDKNVVTIFGESAGAGSVGNHMVAPKSWPYFHRAMMESGPIAASWIAMPMDASESNLNEVLKRLKCPPSNSAELALACLRSKNFTEIQDAGHDSDPHDDPGGVHLISWSPVVDGIELPDSPRVLLQKGKVNRVPVLLGSNHDEGTEFVKPKGDKMTLAVYKKFVNTTFGPTLAPAVLEHYPASNYKSPWLAGVDALGDQAMSCPARETARLLSDAKVPVYLYFFVHELNWLKIDSKEGKALGVFHGSELIFVFDKTFVLLGKGEKALAQSFGEWWTSFATSGVPASKTSGATWPAYTRANDLHLTIDVGVGTKASNGLKKTVCDFWATTPLYTGRMN
jgi:para-nitrobenzyl esterase